MNARFPRFTTIVRFLTGLAFFIFGINGFLHFLPMPPMEGAAGAFMGALGATGYMFPLLKFTETLVGVLLMTGFFVPLALALIAPCLVNILAFHVFLAPGGILLPLVLLAGVLALAWQYRSSFLPMLRPNAEPTATEHDDHVYIPASVRT